MSDPIQLVAQAEHVGLRLDLFLAHSLAKSRASVQTMLKEGRVVKHPPAAPLTASDKIRTGDHFFITEKTSLPFPDLIAEEMALSILHEDESLLVLDKPAGLVVHPAAGHLTGTLVHALLHHCRDHLSARGGEERLGIVHRLDKETSGLMVIAKTDSAHEALSRQFHDREVEKIYLAIAKGKFRHSSGKCLEPIGRHPVHRKKMAVLKRGGRAAHTDYKILQQWKESALVQCTLHTGRTHQIRVHLAHLGHPIIGDTTYGRAGRSTLPLTSRQLLHAAQLGFIHPLTKKQMRFEAPLPPDFEMFIKQIEKVQE